MKFDNAKVRCESETRKNCNPKRVSLSCEDEETRQSEEGYSQRMYPLQALSRGAVAEVFLTTRLARPGPVNRGLAEVDGFAGVVHHAAACETGYVTGGHHFIALFEKRDDEGRTVQ